MLGSFLARSVVLEAFWVPSVSLGNFCLFLHGGSSPALRSDCVEALARLQGIVVAARFSSLADACEVYDGSGDGIPSLGNSYWIGGVDCETVSAAFGQDE